MVILSCTHWSPGIDSLGVLPIKSKVQEFLKVHLFQMVVFSSARSKNLVRFFTACPRYQLAQLGFV